MKKALKIATVYIGLVIGAGFASGREILEYFNFRSNTNISGVLIAAFLFMIIAYLILAKSSEEGISDFDSYITSVAGRTAPLVRGFMLVYMFCGLFVMFSGSGALTDSLSLLPDFYGSVLMALICFAILSFDLIHDSELPMLTLAALCGKLCKRVYTAVLFMAICTTAVSYGFGLMSHFSDKIKTSRQRVLFSAVLCLTALPFSLYGFSNLVSQLYSAFGYIGMIWIVMVIVDKYR